jgi:hypothetical protein
MGQGGQASGRRPGAARHAGARRRCSRRGLLFLQGGGVDRPAKGVVPGEGGHQKIPGLRRSDPKRKAPDFSSARSRQPSPWSLPARSSNRLLAAAPGDSRIRATACGWRNGQAKRHREVAVPLGAGFADALGRDRGDAADYLDQAKVDRRARRPWSDAMAPSSKAVLSGGKFSLYQVWRELDLPDQAARRLFGVQAEQAAEILGEVRAGAGGVDRRADQPRRISGSGWRFPSVPERHVAQLDGERRLAPGSTLSIDSSVMIAGSALRAGS